MNIPPITILPIDPFTANGRTQNPGIVPPWLTTPALPTQPVPGGAMAAFPTTFTPAPVCIVDNPDVPHIW